MNRLVKTNELFMCRTTYLEKLFSENEYPWEMLPKIKAYILQLIQEGMPGFTEIAEGVFIGANVKIYPTATIEALQLLVKEQKLGRVHFSVGQSLRARIA